MLLGEHSKYFKLPQELELLRDQETRTLVEQYAQDQNLFFDHYARAHVKMSELGQEEHLLSELDSNDTKSGGYIEPVTKFDINEETPSTSFPA